jgi:hypothetical protein
MIGDAMNEVIDSFIPWKDISRAYFQSQASVEAAPAEAPAPVSAPAPPPAPAPALVEEPPKAVQFDEEDDDESDGPPPIALGETVELDDSEFETDDDNDSVKLEPKETVSLNL